MTMNDSVRAALGALTLMAACLGFTPNAEAAFGVRLDCHGDNGVPHWATTKDVVVVEVQLEWGAWHTIYAGTVSNCAHDNTMNIRSDAFEAWDVVAIRVSMPSYVFTGKDCFWWDDIEIWDVDFSKRYYRWGKDNNVGVCISNEWDDGDSAHCYRGRAYPSFKLGNIYIEEPTVIVGF